MDPLMFVDWKTVADVFNMLSWGVVMVLVGVVVLLLLHGEHTAVCHAAKCAAVHHAQLR